MFMGNSIWSWCWKCRCIIKLTIILIFSLPLWKRESKEENESSITSKSFTLSEIIRISGSKEVMITFFCYCALEQTTGLWASSYLTLNKGMSIEKAASFASMFYVGITIGRVISGFITMKLNDSQMICGVQMASAYIGTLVMPPIFGFMAEDISIALYPMYLFILLCIMSFMYKLLLQKKSW